MGVVLGMSAGVGEVYMRDECVCVCVCVCVRFGVGSEGVGTGE